jgi:Spy/CpxP family protein refolding chaperone
MKNVKTLAMAAALLLGASSFAMAQYSNSGSNAAGGGIGTESGHPSKAQNNNRGPGKDTNSQTLPRGDR